MAITSGSLALMLAASAVCPLPQRADKRRPRQLPLCTLSGSVRQMPMTAGYKPFPENTMYGKQIDVYISARARDEALGE